MSERLKFQGRLTEKELELKKLKMKIDGHIRAIRDRLDPFEPTADLQLDIVAEMALELAEIHIQWKSVAEEIKALQKALGRA